MSTNCVKMHEPINLNKFALFCDTCDFYLTQNYKYSILLKNFKFALIKKDSNVFREMYFMNAKY